MEILLGGRLKLEEGVAWILGVKGSGVVSAKIQALQSTPLVARENRWSHIAILWIHPKTQEPTVIESHFRHADGTNGVKSYRWSAWVLQNANATIVAFPYPPLNAHRADVYAVEKFGYGARDIWEIYQEEKLPKWMNILKTGGRGIICSELPAMCDYGHILDASKRGAAGMVRPVDWQIYLLANDLKSVEMRSGKAV